MSRGERTTHECVPSEKREGPGIEDLGFMIATARHLVDPPDYSATPSVEDPDHAHARGYTRGYTAGVAEFICAYLDLGEDAVGHVAALIEGLAQ